MIELVEKSIYLKEFDIHVKKYLHPEQIQNIIQSLKEFKTWVSREQNINMLILYYVTDIPKEELEKMDYSLIVSSGMMDAVKQNVENLQDIYNGIEWTESLQRSFSMFLKETPALLKPLQKILEERTNNASRKK